MPDAGFTVRGIPEVKRNLANFPRVLVVGCFAKALARASAVFEQEIAARCPEADYETTSSEEYGTLLENMISKIKIDTQGQGGTLKISFGRKGFVALWVEYGHRLVTHKGKPIGSVVAHPFMRPAFAAAVDRALEVIVETVQEFLKEG